MKKQKAKFKFSAVFFGELDEKSKFLLKESRQQEKEMGLA